MNKNSSSKQRKNFQAEQDQYRVNPLASRQSTGNTLPATVYKPEIDEQRGSDGSWASGRADHRAALPTWFRDGQFTQMYPIITGNAFAAMKLKQTANTNASESTIVDDSQTNYPNNVSQEQQVRMANTILPVLEEENSDKLTGKVFKSQPPPLNLTNKNHLATHPVFREKQESPRTSIFKSMFSGFATRSPPKDKMSSTVDSSTNPNSDCNGERSSFQTATNSSHYEESLGRESSVRSSEETPAKVAQTPSKSKGTSISMSELIDGYSPKEKTVSPPKNLTTTTPSKAAKLLGLSNQAYTPSKASRILGTGLAGDEEFLKPRSARRLSSKEFLPGSPSKRMARILEGAAAKFSQRRSFSVNSGTSALDEEEAMQTNEESSTPAGPGETPKFPMFNKAQMPRGHRVSTPERTNIPISVQMRSSSLKYMDNSIPPTPPEKDTIYKQNGFNINVKKQSSKPDVRSIFPVDPEMLQQTDAEPPIIKGYAYSMKANLVTNPSINSFSGIIETGTTRSRPTTSGMAIHNNTKQFQNNTVSATSLADVFVTPKSMASDQEMTSSELREGVPITLSALSTSEPEPNQSEKNATNPQAHAHGNFVPAQEKDASMNASSSSQPAGSIYYAPPEDLLTHFDIVNTHMMHCTNNLHAQIELLSVNQAQAARKAHADVIATLNAKFSNVSERVRIIEHELGRVVGTASDGQESVTTNLNSLASLIQSSVIKRLDEELLFRGELARRFDHFAFQLQETQMRQQYIIDILKMNGLHLPSELVSPPTSASSIPRFPHVPLHSQMGPGSMFINSFHRPPMAYSAAPLAHSPDSSVTDSAFSTASNQSRLPPHVQTKVKEESH